MRFFTWRWLCKTRIPETFSEGKGMEAHKERSGKLVPMARWDACLNKEEMAELSQGVHPITVRPENLLWFNDEAY